MLRPAKITSEIIHIHSPNAILVKVNIANNALLNCYFTFFASIGID